MKWGKTWGELRQAHEKYGLWFAWYPRVCYQCGRFVWLEYIVRNRVRIDWGFGTSGTCIDCARTNKED